MLREDRTREYKEVITKTYLKTVSAYANYNTGRIFFGVANDGSIKPLKDPVQQILDLENQINDSIHPNPDYSFSIGADGVIILEVRKGRETPYCYRGKAYKRNDSATVEVSEIEFKNLILKGTRRSFTEIPCAEKDLTFGYFSTMFSDRFGIDTKMPDTFITLELYTRQEGFTNGALLLSDENHFPGIDLVIYDKDPHQIRRRESYSNMSVLEMMNDVCQIFEQEYSYETVEGWQRLLKWKVPVEAFRELIANALVHREWMIQSSIRVEFFENGIRVTSPGGLPDGITQEEYLADCHISVIRNKTLAFVFLKLGLIESLGFGLPMIRSLYSQQTQQPEFIVSENYLQTFLPVFSLTEDLTPEEKMIRDLILTRQPVSAQDLLGSHSLSRSTQQRILNSLIEKKIVHRTGNGRGTRYYIDAFSD